VRASTDWTSAADPLVARALVLVAKNLSRPWGVAQLARELGVPPLRLGRHFTAELGHSPGEEILRQRLAKARTLLRETDLPLAKIAELCGFCHASYFSNVFRRETGLSPRKWRKGRG
jgi:transcriptional regulator GlxA family with amidase domain